MEFSKRDRLKLLASASALLLSACGGGSNSNSPVRAVITPPPPPPPPPPATGSDVEKGLLRDSFANNFLVGAAMTTDQILDGNLSGEVAMDQFNSMTAEFEMKPNIIAPTEGEFNFERADQLVDWAIENNIEVRGHALLWHESTPDYFLEGTPEQIRARLETYITTVMNHFKGRVKVWDVVNEVVSDDVFSGDNGIGPDRRSIWWDAVGNADYIEWAFLAARAADPDALLFINDYSTENEIKRAWLIEILQRLQDKNIPIDGVGHQFHILLQTPAEDVLAAVDAVDNQFMGLINHVTELDVSFYTNPGECWQTGTNCEADLGPVPPADRLASQAQLLRDIFNGFKMRSSIESVTTWGVIDSDSWLNTNPVTRFNYPLLFDRQGSAKPALLAITDDNYVIEG